MNKIIIIIILFFLCACDPSQYNDSHFLYEKESGKNFIFETFPVGIFIDENIYSENNIDSVNNVINIYNSFFNKNIFYISDDPNLASIFIRQEKNMRYAIGLCFVTFKGNYLINQSYILLPHENISEIVLAHELWHAIGFNGHYENAKCLNYLFVDEIKDFNDSLFCQDMIDRFNEIYP